MTEAEPPRHCGQIVLEITCPTCAEYVHLGTTTSLAATPQA